MNARFNVTDGTKFPALHNDPTLLLDLNRFSDWLEQEVVTDRTFGSIVYCKRTLPPTLPNEEGILPVMGEEPNKQDLTVLNNQKKRLIHAQYWCDMVRSKGYWPTMLLATNDDDVSVFKKECKRLYRLGVPRGR